MKGGYGQIHHKGKTVYAHRVAWELANGTITDDSYVLHQCDNRRCVNPDHLFLGTFEDNMADMVMKGRQARGNNKPHSKLNAEMVREIRQSDATQDEIAKSFGVSRSLISMVRSGKIWRWVDDIV